MTEIPKIIWLVEDDHVFAESLIYILDHISDLNFARHFLSAEEMFSFINSPAYSIAPDLVLMDIRLPGKSGIEAVQMLRNLLSGIPVVMMTLNDDQQSIVEAMQSGAAGYIIKGDPYDKVLEVIRAATRGMLLMSEAVKNHLIDHLTQEEKSEYFGLTMRQKEVLELMCEGLSKSEIADRLSITHSTADNHFRHIYQKLSVNSAHAAVAKAFREGLVHF